MKVAILYICTGEYWRFFSDFRKSAETHFLTDCERTFIVFTDHPAELMIGADLLIPQDNLGWPLNSLQRFRMFGRIASTLLTFDRVVFLNANSLFVDRIEATDFFGNDQDIVACLHPGFFDKLPEQFTYERRENSTAHLVDGNIYVAGGLMGGKPVPFLALCEELQRNIESDFDRGLLALWHDESHWNTFVNRRIPELALKLHVLDPGYMYPEDWNIPFKQRIVLRDKGKTIDVNTIKGIKYKKKDRTINKITNYTKLILRIFIN